METIERNVTGRKPGASACAERPAAVDPNELIDNAEAAKILRILPQTLCVWRVEKRGPRFLKVGRRVLYRRSDICAWLAAQLSPAGGAPVDAST